MNGSRSFPRGVRFRLGLPKTQLASEPIIFFGGLQVTRVDADAGSFVRHLALLIESILRLVALACLPVGDDHFLVLDRVGAISLEAVRHGHATLRRGARRGSCR